MSYTKMFEKGKIGRLELKNRIVMPAMGCSLAASTGEASQEMITYYAKRAKGGAGLIITEITRIDDETGVGTPNQLSVTDLKHIPQLTRLAEAVHAYNTKIFVQLHHPGNQTPSRLLHGKQIVSASDVTCSVIGEKPRALTTEEVEGLVKKFVFGAYVAKTAGIDGVELHAAHGYLLDQFMSPHTNKRTDRYGGDFNGRMRMITEIIKGIQATCGPHYPISVRMDGAEYIPDGIDQAITAESVLKGEHDLHDQKIVIIGGGVTGLETAETLAKDNQVTVIEMANQVGTTLYASYRGVLLKEMHDMGITIKTEHRLTHIEDHQVYTKHGDEDVAFEADTVVLAMGVKAKREALEDFEKVFDQVILLGDTDHPGQIREALHSAYDRAFVFDLG